MFTTVYTARQVRLSVGDKPSLFTRMGRLAASMYEACARHYRIAAARRELKQMSSRELADMGLSYCTIESATRHGRVLE